MPKLPISFDDPIADDQALADYQAKLPVDVPSWQDQANAALEYGLRTNPLTAGLAAITTDPKTGKRYQTWPEQMARSGASLPLETYQGKVPTSLGLRREDFTDIPQDQQPSNTWLGGKLGLRESPELGPSGELISRAQDMAGMAGGGSVAGVGGEASLASSGKLRKNDYLYHGTTQDAARSIDEIGIEPKIGQFVKRMYGEDAGDELVYLSERDRLNSSVTAMKQQIAQKLNKSIQNVTPEDIENHGVLYGLKKHEYDHYNGTGEGLSKNSKGEIVEETPTGVEPGDWYSRDFVTPSKKLEGKRLVSLLKNQSLLSDTAEPGAAVAALERAPVFYSAVEKAVKEAKQPSASADQWLGYLRNQPGVKQEELDWVLHDLPAGKITKSELEQYVQEHKVELKEVNKGESKIEQNPKEVYDNIYKSTNNGIEWQQLNQRERQHWIEMFNEQNKSPTKYSQWQLPGGDPGSYREQLLTLPKKSKTIEYTTKLKKMQNKYGNRLENAPINELQELSILKDVSNLDNKQQGNFVSSHWSEPNVLAHIRTNERNIPGVGNSLHIEEIQSDWHQAGRKQGYKGELNELQPKFDAIEKKIVDSGDEQVMSHPELSDALKMAVDKKIITADEAKIYKRYSDISASGSTGGVPNAPLKTNWPDLALKRVIRQAAEQGKDSISWTPGEAQALRYPNELRRQVRQIEWIPSETSKGVKQVVIHPTDGAPIGLRVDMKDGIIRGGAYAGKKVDEVFGKDMADKIMKQEEGKLEGKDFVIGAEGMKGFYDKMLVDKANAISKKFGGKVEQGNITKPETKLSYEELQRRRAGEKPDQSKFQQPVHVLRITPQLRDAALNKGFALFADTGKVGAPLAALTKVDHNPFTHTVTPVEHNPFTVDTYHGTPRPFKGTEIRTRALNKFDTDPKNSEFFSTPNPELAHQYAGGGFFKAEAPNIIPLKINAKDYHTIDAKGAPWDAVNQYAIDEAHQLNKKGVIIKNVLDDAHPSLSQGANTVYITLDPSTVRSRFAKFDPAKFHESGLMKASGLPIITDKDGRQLDHNLKPLTVDEQNALLDRNPLPTHNGPDGKAISMPSKTALGLAAMKALEYGAWWARPSLGPALWTSSILAGGVMNAAPKKELKEGRPLGGYRLVPVAHDPFK